MDTDVSFVKFLHSLIRYLTLTCILLISFIGNVQFQAKGSPRTMQFSATLAQAEEYDDDCDEDDDDDDCEEEDEETPQVQTRGTSSR